MILTCFFSMLTLISSIICSCLVFYNEKSRTEINSKEVLANNDVYKSSTIIYNQDNTLYLTGLEPGFSMQQSFSITNNNSDAISYSINWDNVESTWGNNNKPEEFVYSLVCSNGEEVKDKTMPIAFKDYSIVEKSTLKTNQTNNCTITITFINTYEDQFYNMNNTFGGTYKVVIND